MALFWYRLVVSGVKAIEDVPAKWRAEVEAMLENNHA